MRILLISWLLAMGLLRAEAGAPYIISPTNNPSNGDFPQHTGDQNKWLPFTNIVGAIATNVVNNNTAPGVWTTNGTDAIHPTDLSLPLAYGRTDAPYAIFQGDFTPNNKEGILWKVYSTNSGGGLIVQLHDSGANNIDQSKAIFGVNDIPDNGSDESPLSWDGGHFGVIGFANYAPGFLTNGGYCGVLGFNDSDSEKSYGVIGVSLSDVDGQTNIAVAGNSIVNGKTGVNVGGYFQIHSAAYSENDPSFVSSVLLLDNRDTGKPLLVARTNGVEVFQVTSNGNLKWQGVEYAGPTTNGTAGQALVTDGNTPQQLSWAAIGTGSVTSVGLTVPSWLTVGGTPVTGSGTLAVTATTAQTANKVLATPENLAGQVALRDFTETYLNLSDLTTDNVSTTRHGFAPKAPNDTAKFLRGDGTWAAVSGASGGTVTSVGASGPAGFTWSSAVTGSGTLTATTPGYVVTNGNANVLVQSNDFKVDVTHTLIASNITALSVVGTDGKQALTNINIGTGLTLSGNTLVNSSPAGTAFFVTNALGGGTISNAYSGTVVINTNLIVNGGGSSNWIGGSLWVATNIVSLNGQFTGNGAGLTNIPVTSVGLLGDPITNGQANAWSDSNDVHFVKAIATGTTTPAIYLTNATPATVGAQAQSPFIEQDAIGWKTTATAGPQIVGFRYGVVPVQSATSPGAYWKLESQTNGGSWGKPITFSWEGNQTNAGKWIDIGGTGLIIFGDSTVNGQIISAPGSGANLKLKGGTGPASITIASGSARDITWDGTSFYCSSGDRLLDFGQNGTGARALWLSKSLTLNDTTGIGFGTGESLFMSSVNSEVVLTNGAAGTAGQYADLLINGSSALGSDQTTTSATLATTTLSARLAAGVTYTFQAELFLSDSVAADGAQIDFNGGTATATTFIAQVTAFDTALNLSSQGSALGTAYAATTFTGNGAFEVHGTIFVNAAGTIIPRFAQNAHTTGTLTLKKGSFIRFFRAP